MTRDQTRRALIYAATAAAGFVLAYLVVALVILPDDVAPVDVTVPAVVGLTQSDAERRLIAAGLIAALGEERFSADAPKSTVLEQTPPAGSTATRGSSVSLDVSAGQQRATIPIVIGLTRGEAEAQLARDGLQVGQVVEQPGDSARGLVLETRPVAGQTVPMGTRVDLFVSGGPSELTMPDVVGRDQESATGLLQQLGFRLAPIERDSASAFAEGIVVSQSPAAGTAVATGSPVTLRVSARP